MIGGVASQLTGGELLTVENPAFAKLGNSSVLGMTLLSWTFILAALLFAFLLHRTTFGRYLYAVGGNREAARLAGIRTGLVSFSAYALSGLAAGIAGVVVASRQSTGQAEALPGLEFDVIAAVIVGGTSILGGAGAIWRTAVGLALLALIQNGANLLGIDQTYQRIIYGAIILGAAALDVWARRRSDEA
jgi:ribose transport system permease protein